jgi:hypothetical protein
MIALAEEKTDLFARYLDEIGSLRESHDITGTNGDLSDGARGFVALYDLASPSAPRSAETLAAMSAPESDGPGWSCYGPFNAVNHASRAAN